MTRLSAQKRAWQKKQKAAGNCVCCGKPRQIYWERCDSCQEKRRVKNRLEKGFRAWRPGYRGRPPVCHSLKITQAQAA